MTQPSNLTAGGKLPAVTANMIIGPTATALVATGSTQATALQLTADINHITTSAGSTGVKLPQCQKGSMIVVDNQSGQTIAVYPFETSGVTVDSTTSASLGNSTAAIFFGTGVNWIWVDGA